MIPPLLFVAASFSVLVSKENAASSFSFNYYPTVQLSQKNASPQRRPVSSLPFDAATLAHRHTSPSSSSKYSRLSKLFSLSNDDRDRHYTTRREWIKRACTTVSSAAAVASATTYKPHPVAAAETLAAPQSPPIATTIDSTQKPQQSSLCDPTVSSWKKGSRVIHIVGTAHISSVSANLAGRVVQEIMPNAVFVELDLKRINRAFRGGLPPPGMQIGYKDTAGNLNVATVPDRPQQRGGPLNFLGRMINSGAGAMNPIQRMYKGLEREGFLAGEEFIVAVQEGLSMGSVIILGDRDVDVTLQRLAMALSKTDVKKLVDADAQMTQTMKRQMPEIEEWQKSGKFGPDELRTFVETMKTKETVNTLMDTFKQAAPEIYIAMVAERDLFMARNLDNLSDFRKTVAVMGLAHLDGVEKNLKSMEWSPYPVKC